ncbi:MAG TPA: Gfo/Idh/MocA family oxidoreductase, partial [Opitutaceae bacterium]
RNARRFGGTPYSDVAGMLAEQKPDGVMICVGPEAHAILAVQALSLGYPVYTEKPPALCSADALEVARAARKAGLLCTTAFKKRYTVAYTRAKQWIEQRPAGDLLSLSFDYCSAYYDNKPPRTLLSDFGIHVIDVTHYLFGDVESVFAFTKDHHAYAVSLRFANGAVGTLNFNDGRSFAIPTEEVEISARDGYFMTVHNSSSWRITEKNQPSEWRKPPTFTSLGGSGRETGHLAEIEDFVAALREGRRTSRSEIFESYKTMVLYEAIKKASETGEVVKLRYEAI